MKAIYLVLSLAFLPSVAALAQAPSPSPTPSVSTPEGSDVKGDHKGRRREMMESLTPEEKQKLKSARESAQSDPEVKAAEAQRSTNPKAYRQAMRAAMLRKDPSVGAILDKRKGERKKDRVF